MKEKILQLLKTKYASLGLGDEILNAQAETLEKLGLITDENIEAVINGLETSLKAIQKASDKARTEKAKAEKEKQELEEKIKGLTPKEPKETEPKPNEEKPLTMKDIEAIFKKRDEEAENARKSLSEKETRSKFISDKAKELQIPEWRLNEGFSIADDLDNDKITEYLSSVKQNITTAGLEGKNRFPIDTKQTASKEVTDKIAKNLIN